MSEEDIPLFIYKGGGGVPEDVTNVEFHSSVNEVAGRAFSCCRNLKEVLLNGGMQKIGEEAFSFCRSLEIVKFAHCRGLVRLGDHYPQLLRFWEVPKLGPYLLTSKIALATSLARPVIVRSPA
jgi:hypothetical protein